MLFIIFLGVTSTVFISPHSCREKAVKCQAFRKPNWHEFSAGKCNAWAELQRGLQGTARCSGAGGCCLQLDKIEVSKSLIFFFLKVTCFRKYVRGGKSCVNAVVSVCRLCLTRNASTTVAALLMERSLHMRSL